MSAGIISSYDAQPGRAQELTEILLEAASYMSSVGGSSHVRVAWLAGVGAGYYQLVTQFEDVAAQMAGLDQTVADVANNPLNKAVNAPDSPGSLRSRFTYASLDPSIGVQEPTAVQGAMAFQIKPGAMGEVRDLFASIRERHAGLGVNSVAFQLQNAGPMSRTVVNTMNVGSYAELGEFQAKNAALGDALTAPALAAGTLIFAGQLNTMLVS